MNRFAIKFLMGAFLLFHISAHAQLPELALPSTFSGEPTTARFFGGSSADNGQSFGTSFLAHESLDVLTEIQVESTHVGAYGNLYLLIAMGEEVFMRLSDGSYVPWDLDLETLQATEIDKVLEAQESLIVLENIAFADLGLSDVTLQIYLAYDTAASGETLYFSGTPLTLAIESSMPASFDLFVQNISAPIIQARCIVCHTTNGVASESNLHYVNSAQSDFQLQNYNTLINYLESVPNADELILSKPQGQSAHGGGVQLTPGSDQLQDWQEFIEAAFAEIDDNGSGFGSNAQAIFNSVVMMDHIDTLRKAALLFAGRLPTETELAAVENGDDAVLRETIRDLMSGDGFDAFLLESANDRLLTQAFSFNLFNIVDRFYYPNAMEYYQAPGKRLESIIVASSLAEEPLQLIRHVVTNERPYSEILTADYIMLNPYAARIYGGNIDFPDMNDYDDWREGEITEYYRCTICARQSPLASYNLPTDYPHAGVLNSPAFLARYPSTETNRNRARARWTYYYFLGVDIEGLAERTTDQSALADQNNPTLNNSNCTVCHNIMDPVAGAYKFYGDDGRYKDKSGGEHSLPRSYTNDPTGLYQQGDTWFADMLLPGFGVDMAPEQDSLQWLAEEIVSDSRFGFGTVKFWYPAVLGREPYVEPENPEDADYASRLAAYTNEYDMLQEVADRFTTGAAGNGVFNLKDLLIDLVMSDQFRASAVTEVTAVQEAELQAVGTGRLLTPEQLNRKMIDVTGFEWAYGNNNALEVAYNLIYGGIDSFGVTERATELTTLMSTVVTAMANETSCPMVNADFSRPQSQRKLFTEVELSSTPDSDPGGIIANIQLLHEKLLGEALPTNDIEIQSTYELFETTWEARIASGQSSQVSTLDNICIFENVDNPIQTDSNQTLRTWAVVVNYLMRDYKFIYE